MRRLAIVVFGVIAACGAQAQMYKWVDEDGRVQYTQTPPPPGRKVLEIKQKGPGTAQPNAPAQKSAGKGKDKDEIPADARTMLGEWRTHMGARVQVKFSLQQSGASLRSAQSWTLNSSTYATGSGMNVVIAGAKGSGAITTQGGPVDLPDQVRYERRGDGLILTVDAGPFAGTHLLTRP